MKILNNKVILIEAHGFITRLRGLIGKKLEDLTGLELSPCNQIHTFFMKYPIDAVFVSNDNKILHIEKNMMPGKFGKRVKNAKKVIELKSGASGELGLEVGEKIFIDEKRIGMEANYE